MRDVEVTAGALAASVGDERVTIAAKPVPPRIWTAIASFARRNAPLEASLAGRGQSLQLDHLMSEDWDEPLMPTAVERTCTRHPDGACEHVAALAYAVAQQIDRDPSVLLRWRGQGVADDEPAMHEPAGESPVVPAPSDDAWLAGPLPESQPVRPLPAAAVLKRLGRSGVHVGGHDLEDVLQRAYASFSATRE